VFNLPRQDRRQHTNRGERQHDEASELQPHLRRHTHILCNPAARRRFDELCGSRPLAQLLKQDGPHMAGVVRIAAVGDIHCTKTAQGSLQALFARMAEAADMMLLAGDLTDYGLPEEARVLARELTPLRIPTAAVLGNHDVESDKQEEICRILTDAGVSVLDGDATEMLGIGIAGVKGFGGGFGPRALGAWGERIIKQFVHEAIEEALKLEAALARLRTPTLIALLHYSPVQKTVEGEPLEIYPFVGSSRLEEPINRFPVSLVVHGHAHRGQLEGTTKTNVPVYNVSMPLLSRLFPDRPAFRVFEVPVGEKPVATPLFGRRATDAVAS
jgi:Icc-related predicted phosphoesterase